MSVLKLCFCCYELFTIQYVHCALFTVFIFALYSFCSLGQLVVCQENDLDWLYVIKSVSKAVNQMKYFTRQLTKLNVSRCRLYVHMINTSSFVPAHQHQNIAIPPIVLHRRESLVLYLVKTQSSKTKLCTISL